VADELDDDDIMDFLRDMASPTDGPDLTDEEVIELLKAMAELEEEDDPS
jgi:hypothetical protein